MSSFLASQTPAGKSLPPPVYYLAATADKCDGDHSNDVWRARVVHDSLPNQSLPMMVKALTSQVSMAVEIACALAARELRLPTYSRPFTHDERIGVVQLHVPLIDHGAFVGTLMVEYSIEALMRHFVPTEVTRRHTVAVIDEREAIIASSVLPMPGNTRQRAAIRQDGAQNGPGHLDGLAHVAIELFGTYLVDQVHRALHQPVAGNEILPYPRDHVDDRVADERLEVVFPFEEAPLDAVVVAAAGGGEILRHAPALRRLPPVWRWPRSGRAGSASG